jgi:hypothetical protein
MGRFGHAGAKRSLRSRHDFRSIMGSGEGFVVALAVGRHALRFTVLCCCHVDSLLCVEEIMPQLSFWRTLTEPRGVAKA